MQGRRTEEAARATPRPAAAALARFSIVTGCLGGDSAAPEFRRAAHPAVTAACAGALGTGTPGRPTDGLPAGTKSGPRAGASAGSVTSPGAITPSGASSVAWAGAITAALPTTPTGSGSVAVARATPPHRAGPGASGRPSGARSPWALPSGVGRLRSDSRSGAPKFPTKSGQLLRKLRDPFFVGLLGRPGLDQIRHGPVHFRTDRNGIGRLGLGGRRLLG